MIYSVKGRITEMFKELDMYKDGKVYAPEIAPYNPEASVKIIK